MAHFDKDFLAFFKELEKNNNKEWFDENRKRYEKTIKVPFKAFILELVEALQPFYPDVDLGSNFQIMRINRDIRFSADKTPYKIHMGGMIMPEGVKDKTRPGLYVQMNHKDVRIYSGAHDLEKNQLHNVRSHISYNLEEFSRLISDKKFVDTFGEILGEKNKRLPVDFREAEQEQPLIANKSFYWFVKMDPKLILSDNLIEELVKRYEISLPLNTFFNEALN